MDTNDSSLLREFVKGNGNHAFRQFVERYQDMVFSTALRRTGDRGLAEEVAQDVFLFVAEQAKLLILHPNLAGWLYNTTLKKAANRMKQETRRKLREGRYADHAQLATESTDAPAEAYALIDEALAGLGAKEREALVLRYFQGHDLSSVGRAQGSTAEAARKRVDRSLEKLRDIFRRKGVAVSSTSALVAVLAGSTQPAPAMLLTSVTTSAAAITPAIPSLTAYITNTIITMTKTQIITAAVALAAIAVGVQQVTKANTAEESNVRTPQIAEAAKAQPDQSKQPALVETAVRPEAVPVADQKAEFLAEMKTSLEAARAYQLRIEQTKARSQVKALAKELGLDENQASMIERRALANVEREHERQQNLMKALASAKGDLAEIERISTESKEIGLFDGIEQDLYEEQMKGFEEFTKNQENVETRKMAESMTYQDMKEMQTSLKLTKEKQEAVFAILYAENEAMLSGPEEQPLDPGTAEPFKRNVEQRQQERMRKLSEVLTAEELAIYQKQLQESDAETDDE